MLCLSFAITPVVGVSSPVYALERNTDGVLVEDCSDYFVGQLYTINARGYLGTDTSLSDISYVPTNAEIDKYLDGEPATAQLSVEYNSGRVFVRPVKRGTAFVKLNFQNGMSLVLCGFVRDSSTESKKDYCSLWGIDDVTTIGNITNNSDKTVTPDLRIAFFDESKKVIGYAQATKQIGSTIHKILSPGESGWLNMSADESELPSSRLNDIAFWKIIELDKKLDDSSSIENLDDSSSTENLDDSSSIENLDDSSSTENNDNSAGISSNVSLKFNLKKKSSTSFNVSWSSVTSSKRYTVQCALSKNFKKGKITKHTYKDSITFKKLGKGKTYYVRMKEAGGKWSDIQTIKLK